MQRSTKVVLALVILLALAPFANQGASAAGPTTGARQGPSIAVNQRPPQTTTVIGHPVTQPVDAISTKLRREVFGFALASSLSDPTVGYPSWNFSLLSTVAFFALHVNWDGTLAQDSSWNVWNSSALTGLLNKAHASGTKVVLTIDLQDFSPGTPNMCAGLINRSIAVSRTVQQVTAKGVDGVNIDYEGLNGTCQNGQTTRSMLTAFVSQLHGALPAGSYLSIDTYASSAGDPIGFFDIANLNSYVDTFMVMAYDLEYSNYHRSPVSCSSFCLGPTSPLTGYYYNDTTTASQYLAVVSASKVILGVPYYGRKSCVAGAAANAYPIGPVTADSYLNAVGESSASAVLAGSYTAHRDANDPAGQERWDTWYNTALKCTRELYWDDSASLGAKYDLINSDGLRGAGIWTLNYGGGAPELWAVLSSRFLRCSGVSASSSKPSPAGVGTAVTFTAQASGCPNPLYEFWVLPPGASTFQLLQAYSPSRQAIWRTNGLVPGTYRLSVWARDANSTGSYGNNFGRWDAYDNATVYTLTSCAAVGVSVSPASPSGVGSAVTITANASGCPDANPLYQFSLLAPGAAGYRVAQSYSTNAAFKWSTAGLAPGTYRFSVWAKDANSGGAYGNSAGRWDVYNNNDVYTLTPTCSAIMVSVSPASPASAGTTITLTAHATGCPNPLYQFWILPPGGTSYHLLQAYSSNGTLVWKTGGLAKGSYRVSIWAKDASSSGLYGNQFGRWDAYNNSILYAIG